MKKNLSFLISLVLIFTGVILLFDKNKKQNEFRDAPGDFYYLNSKSVKQNYDNSIPAVKAKYDTKESGSYTYRPVAIYGENNIKEYYEVNSSLRKIANSVVALVHKDWLYFDETDNRYHIVPTRDFLFDKLNNLIIQNKDETMFLNQKILSFCSGALVSDDLVLTAGHCISDQKIDPETGKKNSIYYRDIYIVFNWKKSTNGNYKDSFSKDEVFKVNRIIVRELKGDISDINNYRDYALVELSKRALKYKPLPIERADGFLIKGAPVFTIGYPAGMSVKITEPDAAKIGNVGDYGFTANIDHFAGNSGSPVFNSYTKRITGILVSGDADFYIIVPENIKVKIIFNQDSKLLEDSRENDYLILKTNSKKLFKIFMKHLSNYSSIYTDKLSENELYAEIPAKFKYPDTDIILNTIVETYGFNINGLEKILARYPNNYYGTGIQKIHRILKTFIPLTQEELNACRKLESKLKPPVIDPKLLMLYKEIGCRDNGYRI